MTFEPRRLARICHLLAPALLLAGACGDGPRSSEEDTDSTTGVTGVSMTNPSTTLDPSDTDPSTTSTTNDTMGGSTGGTDVCETVQCGDACCAAGQECVLGECRDACDSGVRCGDSLTTCCGSDQVCLQPNCVTPGDACVDSFDCPIGEFCEPTVGYCLPQQDPVACEVLPEFEQVQVELEWSYEMEQTSATPMVGDIDGDGLPEVVVSTFGYQDVFVDGIILVFAGESGELQFAIGDDNGENGSWAYATPGLADVNGNGLPDIVYAGRAGQCLHDTNQNRCSFIHAVDGTGSPIWTSNYRLFVRNGAPTFTNLDNDDEAEIIFGGAILDNNGTIVWDGGQTIATPEGTGQGLGPLIGSNTNISAGGLTPNELRRGYGGVTAAADLTGDGYPELITGRRAFSVTWLAANNVLVSELWDAGAPDGWPAIGDLDGNGSPEVVLVGDGTLRVLDGATGNLWCGVDATGAMCTTVNDPDRTQPVVIPDTADPVGRGGPPTIADFDGDGRPEVATAAAQQYTVFDFNRAGETVVQPGGDAPPAAGAIYRRWSVDTLDSSSNGTGSSVFDFQGDGEAEVLYGDECYFRVYEGSTGNVIAEIENSSVTNREYPIVVDVDADGNSEIVVVANDQSAASVCSGIPNYGGGRRGVYVYGDPNDEWVRTRRVWPSHTYHVTNSDSRGHIPPTEDNNWEQEGLNNYRQNVQGPGVFNAPDLSVDVAVGLQTCLDEEFEIIATVRNEGSLGVPAGIEVNLYEGTDATGTLIGPSLTQNPLLPGAFEQVSWTVPAPGGEPKNFFVAIDGVDTMTSAITECNEDNNTASTVTVACPNQG